MLGEACDERLAVGKAGRACAAVRVLDDGTDVRAPIAGVVAGLRAATHDVAVVPAGRLPAVTADVLRTLGDACRTPPCLRRARCPARRRRSALLLLESRLAAGPLALVAAYDDLDVVTVQVDPALVADVDTPGDLARLTNPG